MTDVIEGTGFHAFGGVGVHEVSEWVGGRCVAHEGVELPFDLP